MSRRMGLVGGIKLPTFAELFGTINGVAQSGQYSASAGTLTQALPSTASVGDVWYYFFCVGSSLEIARIDYSSNSISKTQLQASAESGQTVQTFSVSGTDATSNNTLYGGNFVCLRFDGTYSPDIIDAMFTQGIKECPKYSYGSSMATSVTNRLEQSATSGFTGVCFVAYRGAKDYTSGATKSNNFSISTWSEPLIRIIARQNNTLLNRTVIMAYTTGGVSYYQPSTDGSSNLCYTYSYSMFTLKEGW